MSEKFSIGKKTSSRDEDLKIEVGYDDTRQLVVVVFDAPVEWFALTKEHAEVFAKVVEGHARFIRKEDSH